MSIPCDSNPLGWDFIRYTQPVMTSNSTWSNEPTFGCTVSGYEFVYPRWRVLTPRKNTGGTSTWYSVGRSKALTVAFEKPLVVLRMEIAQRFESNREGPNWLKVTGDAKTLVEFYDEDRAWGAAKYRWFECERIGKVQRLDFYYTYNSGPIGKIDAAQLYPVVLDAWCDVNDLR